MGMRAIILAAIIMLAATPTKATEDDMDKEPTRDDCVAVVMATGLAKKSDFEETKIGPPNKLRPTLHAQVGGRYSFYCTGDAAAPIESAEILIFEASDQETRTLIKTFAAFAALVHIRNSEAWTASTILTTMAMSHGEATLRSGTGRLFISTVTPSTLGPGSIHLRAEDLAARPW